ncbi:copper resistance protein CopC [Micromonospora zingiberis]|uniref:Copper resistance protein CopC n=1 Tax=Micromonospora zingiberis TaxID=2053011 RepID=A0A4V2LWZ7_9ACTN|nr:copper resistance protein CopC [Micromonospora zingiberis]TCB98455.1 copper resistance protein CopC [Micromonospora zingiberis]
MRRLPRTPMRVTSGLLALVLATAVAVLAAAPPAAAHGGLAMSTPAADATVTEPLTAVQLYFTEQVVPNAYFAVTAPGGTRVDNGWNHGAPRQLDQPVREYFLVDGMFQPREYTTGFPAVVNLAHLPAAGQYTVSYLSVASDGELVRGTMSFRYTGPVTPAPAGWSPPTGQPDPALLAAAEQHGHDGGSSSASAAPPASAPPAAAPVPARDGGPGAGTWTAVAVAIALALTGLLAWRRPATVARLLGRPGAAAGNGRRSGAATRNATRKNAAPRSGGGTRTGSGARRAATGAGQSTTASGPAAKGKAGSAGADGRRRTAAVPAARRGGAAVTASVAPAAPASTAGPAAASTAGPEAVSSGGVATAEAIPLPAMTDAGEPAPAERSSNTRLALLVGGLVIALLAGFGLGRLGAAEQPGAIGAPPSGASGAGAPVAGSAGDGHQHPPGTSAHAHTGDGSDQTQATGAWVSAAGYTLQPVQRSQPPGVPVDYQFRIVDGNRQAATDFAVVHEKPLHLIVVGRDLSGYQHLHPTMTADGRWSVPLELPRAGDYRIYADFTVTTADGRQLPLVLGVDHHVPGVYTPAQLPAPTPQATAGPFTVSIEGTPTIGLSAPVVLRVAGAAGSAELERYLGAYGHLVVVREGDLGYVHVHPEPDLVDGAVKFWLTVPSAGRYRAFFDFQVDGKVHTAEYTIDLG